MSGTLFQAYLTLEHLEFFPLELASAGKVGCFHDDIDQPPASNVDITVVVQQAHCF